MVDRLLVSLVISIFLISSVLASVPSILYQTPADGQTVSGSSNEEFSVTYTEQNLDKVQFYWNETWPYKCSWITDCPPVTLSGCESGTGRTCSIKIDLSKYQEGSKISYYFGVFQKNGSSVYLMNNQNKAYAVTISRTLTCEESWDCSDWSTCVNNQQTRTCTDENDCGTTDSKPKVSQSCVSQDTNSNEFCYYENSIGWAKWKILNPQDFSDLKSNPSKYYPCNQANARMSLDSSFMITRNEDLEEAQRKSWYLGWINNTPAVINQTNDQTDCRDSDGGKDYYTKGKVIITNYNDDTKDTAWDKCSIESDDNLAEYYCDGNNLGRELYLCQNGCSNGACIRSEGNENSPNNATNVTITSSCNGCLSNNTCFLVGVRKSGEFCSENGTFINQLKKDKSCENNFECQSNVCISEKCISQGLIDRILNWFRRLFGGD